MLEREPILGKCPSCARSMDAHADNCTYEKIVKDINAMDEAVEAEEVAELVTVPKEAENARQINHQAEVLLKEIGLSLKFGADCLNGCLETITNAPTDNKDIDIIRSEHQILAGRFKTIFDKFNSLKQDDNKNVPECTSLLESLKELNIEIRDFYEKVKPYAQKT